MNAADRAINPPPEDASKRCTICRIKKPLSEFFNTKSYKDGKQFRCKSCSMAADKKYTDEHYEKRWAIATLNHHRRRGVEVNITSDELTALAMATRRCPICDCQLDWKRKTDGRLHRDSPTLDRKNNEIRMSINSVCILCHRCNTMKGDLTIPELLEWCDKARLWAEKKVTS